MTEIVKDTRIDNIRAWLTKLKPQLQMAAPKHLTPDRILRIAMTSIQRTPRLLECRPESLMGAVLTCTQCGLEPDGASGLAYLVPFRDKRSGTTTCTLIIGYRGLMALARRSGEIANLEARVVYENDTFSYEYGTAPKIHHAPTMNEPGKMIAVYAVAVFKSGGCQFEVMSRPQVDAIRQRSRASDDGPWVTDYTEMARKTVLKRLCKYLPSSPELAQAVIVDDQAEVGPQDFAPIDVEISQPDKPASRTAQLEAQIGKQRTVAPSPIDDDRRADMAAGTDDSGGKEDEGSTDTPDQKPEPAARKSRRMTKAHLKELKAGLDKLEIQSISALYDNWGIVSGDDMADKPNDEFDVMMAEIEAAYVLPDQPANVLTAEQANDLKGHCAFFNEEARSKFAAATGLVAPYKEGAESRIPFQECLALISKVKAGG